MLLFFFEKAQKESFIKTDEKGKIAEVGERDKKGSSHNTFC